MKIAKIVLGILLAIGLVAALVLASLPKPVDVDVAAVIRGPLVVTVDTDGKTRVQDRYELTAPLYGNLARIELDPGDAVQEGEVIARLSPLASPLLDPRSQAELQARVKAAEASRRQAVAAAARAEDEYKFSKRQLARAEQLRGSGALPLQELDTIRVEARHAQKQYESAKFGVQVAKHQLDMANAALGRKGSSTENEPFELTSPVGGQVLRVSHESEGVLNPGASIMELGDPNALEVVADVLTQDAVRITPGAEVRIQRWGGGQVLPGKVQRVEPSAFTKVSALGVEEQRVNVVIALDEERPDTLGDGFHVDVSIVVWSSEDTLFVPTGALHRNHDDWAVFLFDAGEERVYEHIVTIGERSGIDVQVLSGIKEGESVVVHPSGDVKDGVRVAVRSSI